MIEVNSEIYKEYTEIINIIKNEIETEELSNDSKELFVHEENKRIYKNYYNLPINKVFLLNSKPINSQQVKGGAKKGRPILYYDTKTATLHEVFKLSNRHTMDGGEISTEELKTIKRYSGKIGHVTHIDTISYKKKKEDTIYKKQIIFLEPFTGNLWDCLPQKDKNPPQLHTLNEKNIYKIFFDVAQGLQAMHTENVIHGDIDPANMLYKKTSSDEIEKAAICDFGFLTKEDEKIPKPLNSYWCLHNARRDKLSPESLQHMKDIKWLKKNYSRKANDIYALGNSMYALLYQKSPSWHESLLKQDPEKLCDIQQNDIEDIVKKQNTVLEMIQEFEEQPPATLLDKMKLTTLKMLHPNAKERTTVDQVVEHLKTIGD